MKSGIRRIKNYLKSDEWLSRAKKWMDEKDAISLRNFEINQLNPNNLEFPISYKLAIIPERGVKGKSRGIADKEIHIDIKDPTQIKHTATHE